MTLWKIYTFLMLAVPSGAFLLGLLCWRFPPAGPTWALGYRSRRARASDESWIYAQTVAGRIWFCLGLLLIIIAIPAAGKLRDLGLEDMTYRAIRLILIEDLLIFLSLIPTEFLLLKKFDRFGRPRRQARPAYTEPEPEDPICPVEETEEEFEPLESEEL